MLEVLIWCLTVVLMLGGLVGVVIPLLPGTTLILFATILHKLLLPASLSWLAVGVIGGCWLLSLATDLAGVILGTKWMGGGKWGMAGAGSGALVGAFISLPALVLGTIFGAVAAEKLLGRKSDRQALRAGVGAATGFVLSTIARIACALGMIGFFAYATLSQPGG